MTTEISYGGLAATFNTKRAGERAKWRYVFELARELKTPTDPKNWNVCRCAAWNRAAKAEGGIFNG